MPAVPWSKSPPVLIANLDSVLPTLFLLKLLYLLLARFIHVEHEERARIVFSHVEFILKHVITLEGERGEGGGGGGGGGGEGDRGRKSKKGGEGGGEGEGKEEREGREDRGREDRGRKSKKGRGGEGVS